MDESTKSVEIREILAPESTTMEVGMPLIVPSVTNSSSKQFKCIGSSSGTGMESESVRNGSGMANSILLTGLELVLGTGMGADCCGVELEC